MNTHPELNTMTLEERYALVVSRALTAEAKLAQAEARATKAEIRADTEASIINRIWKQLGNPTYESLKGRSIYDLIDELKERATKAEAENTRLREALNSVDRICTGEDQPYDIDSGDDLQIHRDCLTSIGNIVRLALAPSTETESESK